MDTARDRRDGAEGWIGRLRERVARSAWAPLGARLGAYLGMFVALAAVGSGALTGMLPTAGGESALAALVQPFAGAVVAAPPAPDGGTADAGTVDAEAPVDAGPVEAGAEAGVGVTADGKVVLNAATEDDLRRLPGVGPSKARAILALRAKLGRIRRAEDLLRVRGIGRRSLARLRPLLVVDP